MNLTNNASRAQRNANKSALLRLPPKIRRRIWSWVLQVSRNLADTVEIATRYYPMGPVTHPSMTVLRTCRQIHAETCLLPYTVTTFCFYEPEAFEEWVKNRLPEQKAAVERIAIFCSDCTEIPLRWLPSLKSVDVYCICDGNCPDEFDWPERGEAILEALEASWGNDDLEVRFLSCSGSGSDRK